MAQIFEPAANLLLRIGLVLAVAVPVAAVALTLALARSDYVTGEEVTVAQPVPFSHRHHVGGLGLDCRYCHASAEISPFAGLPPTRTCMTCHSQLWTGAGMLAPVRRSLAEGVGLRWNRVHDLPDFAYFSHAVHVNNGVGCTTCHGPVERMPLVWRSAPLTMGWCLDCHRDPAPRLRPPGRIYDADWTPEPGDDADLMRRYAIDATLLEDCSTCHR